MALRLAGEEFSVVQGLDRLGWTREVRASDALAGLKITQSGSGMAIQLVRATAGGNWMGFYVGENRYGRMTVNANYHLELATDDGDLVLLPAPGNHIDLRAAIVNSGAGNNGRASFADDVELQAGYKLFNLTVEAFTEATKPSAAGNAGRIVYVSDGAAGSKFQGSDGTSWVSLG